STKTAIVGSECWLMSMLDTLAARWAKVARHLRRSATPHARGVGRSGHATRGMCARSPSLERFCERIGQKPNVRRPIGAADERLIDLELETQVGAVAEPLAKIRRETVRAAAIRIVPSKHPFARRDLLKRRTPRRGECLLRASPRIVQ